MKYKPNRRDVVKGIAAGTAGLVAGGLRDVSEAVAQDQMAGFASLAKAAEGEGPVVWYETTATQLIKPCIEAFNKRYPKVQVEHVRAIGTGDMVAKVIQESRTGGSGKTADLLTTTPDQIYGIASRDLALEVNWTQYGIPQKFAPEKHAVICAHSIFCVVHNTQKLTEAEFPKSWDDLTDPRWKGKIGSPAFSHPYAGLVPVWGEARVDAFMEKFMQNSPVLTPSSYTLAQQVGSGELMVTVGLNWTARPVIKAGGPVKLLFPDPLPINTNYSMLPKLAKNVNAAKLYACWLTTDEGAKAYEAATGRGNIFRDTEISKVKLPTWSEFPIKDVPKFAALIEKYNKVLRKG